MSVLAEALVAIGVKGQNVVLSELNKIKKQADAISKIKPTVDLGKGRRSNMPTVPTAPSPEKEKSDKKQKENTTAFKKAADKFGGGVKSFTGAAATFNPLAVVKSVTSGFGSALSGISAFGVSLGNLPKGVSEIANSLTDMASGALSMAKQSASAQYGLTRRNATTSYYQAGGTVASGRMSRDERANLIMTIAGAYGKLQKPLITELNKLVGTKDTAALGRVASGNWQSLGTTKGWLLQQMSDQFSGLPPEIAQKFQAELLKRYGGDIQGNAAERGQQRNAAFMNRAEDQTAAIYNRTAGRSAKTFDDLDRNLNTMQMQLVNTGVTFTGAVVSATNALKALPETINKINMLVDKVVPSSLRSYVPKVNK